MKIFILCMTLAGGARAEGPALAQLRASAGAPGFAAVADGGAGRKKLGASVWAPGAPASARRLSPSEVGRGHADVPPPPAPRRSVDWGDAGFAGMSVAIGGGFLALGLSLGGVLGALCLGPALFGIAYGLCELGMLFGD